MKIWRRPLKQQIDNYELFIVRTEILIPFQLRWWFQIDKTGLGSQIYYLIVTS